VAHRGRETNLLTHPASNGITRQNLQGKTIPKIASSGVKNIPEGCQPMTGGKETTRIGSLDIHKRSVVCHVLDVFFDENENRFVAESRALKKTSRSLVGLSDLAEFLKEFNVKQVVMESSGPYGLKVYYFLESEGFDVYMVPAQDNKPRRGKKTDVEDAKRLARNFVANSIRAYKLPSDPKIRSLRIYVRSRKKLVDKLVAVKNMIIKTFDEACIDIKSVFSNFGKGFLAFLEAYLKGESLDAIIRKWPRFGKKREKLEEILRTRLDEASLITLSSYLRLMKVLMKEISRLDAHIESLLAEFSKEVGLLLTIPGVGLKSAAVIISEIGDIKRFASPKKLASYAGLVPTVYQSGGKTVYGKLRRECNRRLRWILYEVAINAVKVSPWLRSFYERLILRGKARKQALIAVARKIAVGVWHILMRDVPWKERLQRSICLPKKRRVSRVAVREALRILREAGYIVIKARGAL